MIGVALSGLTLAVIAGHWAPLAWAGVFVAVLLIEGRVSAGLAAAAAAGRAPSLTPYAIWTFVQSLIGTCFAPLAWFLEPRHGDTIAALFLAAAAFNAVVTLRASMMCFMAGIGATTLMAIALPVADYFINGGRFEPNVAIVLSVGLFAMHGGYVLADLRRGDDANRRARLAAERAQRASQQASVARNEFVERMKRAVRTPMTALTGSSHALGRTALPPEARVHVDALVEAGEVLATVLDDLVDLDAIESGRLAINPRPCDPRALVRSVSNAFRIQAEDKGLELLVDIAANAPGDVLLDAVRVRQILFNLISNGVTYTQSGGVRVRLQAMPSDKPGHVRLGFAVADTGLGMTRADLAAHLGDRRAQGTRKGLGLSISAKLARLMGATLAAKSTPGQGSQFSLVLEAERAAAQPAAPAPHQDGPRILVLAARAEDQRVIGAVLETTTASFEIVTQGGQALEALHAEQFDLVIADQRTPDFDAIEIAELLRQGGKNAGTPVMALVESEAEAAMCLESGVDGCIVLPIAATAFMDEIARVIGAPPLRDERAA